MSTEIKYQEKTQDIISEQGIRKHLSPSLLNFGVDVYETVDSTNDICRKEISDERKTLVVSGHQTKGRGRLGRSFFSPEDTGLYMSLILRNPPYTAEEAVKITTMAAVSVCTAIEETSGKEALIKWVNDVFVSGRKVCGILTEASPSLEGNSLEYAILGIGINVYMPIGGFPEDIAGKAGAILDETTPESRNRLVGSIANNFMKYYLADCDNREKDVPDSGALDYIEEYRQRCFVLGQEILVINGESHKKATAVDIDDRCRLVVRYGDGTLQTLNSGEIQLL